MMTMTEQAKTAKSASYSLATATTASKNEALEKMAQALCDNAEKICEANAQDMEKSRQNGMTEALLDRLLLTTARVFSMAEGMRQIADLKDPVLEVLSEIKRPNGLVVKKVRVPMGLIGIIYEGRPNVTADAAALCFKAGSAVLLRCSSSAYNSCHMIVEVLREALVSAGFDKNLIMLNEDKSREAVNEMLRLREYIDLIIPRGGASLIKNAVENSTVPVLETGTGNCHVYVDETADYTMARDIIINAKTQRTGVCNAIETILIHETWAKAHLKDLLGVLSDKKVSLHGDELSKAYSADIIDATEDDWALEYLAMALAVKVVKDVTEAVEHIGKYSTKHTECIVSETAENVNYFMSRVDAAVVCHNASTRFTDGFEFGFGAELGISTQKLHARGPMGLEEICSYKYFVEGTGQVRA